MIEATCTACGNINHVAEAEIPVGAKFVNCATCKARVALPTKTAIGASNLKPPAVPPIPKDPGFRPPPDLGLSDLPAPKARSSALGAEPSAKAAPRSGLAAALDADLPAPRGPRPPPAASQLPPIDLGDLLPPTAGVGSDRSDLPAPKSKSVRPATPTSGISDLPAPKTRGVPEIPTLKHPGDLPAPKPKVPAIKPPAPPPPPNLLEDLDLPTPRADLLTPKHAPAGISDLLTPKPGILDLPTPKPGGATDLLAPKGFFDDLPQPANPNRPDLPAPKGFFDDLPGKQNPNRASKPELPAPKGFFDDLPGRVNPNKPQVAEPPAPKGFFDDLPGRVNPNKPQVAEPPAPKGFFDDLPQPSKKPAGMETSPPPLPSRAGPSVQVPIDLDAGFDGGPALDLGIPTPPPIPQAQASSSQFDDLDLSKPTTGQMRASTASEVRNEAGKRAAQAPGAAEDALPPVRLRGTEATLELEEPRPVSTSSQKLGPKRRPEATAAGKNRSRKVLVVMLLLVGLGGGGFMFYRRWAAKQAAAEKIDEELQRARASINANDPGHWDRAAGAARKVLEQDDKHAEALAIAAEGSLASGLANGVNAGGKLGNGRRYIATALTVGPATPTLSRAQALSAIAGGTGDAAVEKLKPLITQDPKNATLQLYLAWAHVARGDFAEAIKVFDQAAALGVEAIKLYALYGRAQARLAQVDLAGARADFDAVYQLDKANIGAQVGLAASMPIAQAQAQEEELRAILARPDLDQGDPRAVCLAWVLSAETATRGNRLDAARERYRKALAVNPDDQRALSGLAEVEMLDGKLDAASEQVKKALALSKDDIRAQLVQAELSIRQRDLRDAQARVDTLLGRTPPPPVAMQARIKLVAGKLYEAQENDERAVTAFEEAAKLAGEIDLAPTLAAVAKLSAIADKAAAAKDPAKASELRERADKLLMSLALSAEKDPQLALTLGSAYLQASDAIKAEPWLRRFVEARPKEAEGHYQLAKALVRLGRPDEAIRSLQKALELAPTRGEIGIELARTYESSGRDDEAAATFSKLLTMKDPSLELRARAGRFFAARGEIAKAAEQGAKILETEPAHTAGLFLKAEGMLAADRSEDARTVFLRAVEAEKDPQYLDGLGRASEALALKSGDTRIQDAAIRAYAEAAELAPTLFNPQAGLGRLYLARRESTKAVSPLLAAYNIKKDPAVAYNLGMAYKELQQIPVAIQWFNESLKLAPSSEASWNLGQLYFDANQGKLAAGALEVATRDALDYEKKSGKRIAWLTDALHKLGRVQKDMNNLPAARDAWEKYIGRDPPKSVQLDEVKRALATSLRGN
ncbi:MAG: tetratricopeptide repeat protein [Kofleriaceae bacterium]